MIKRYTSRRRSSSKSRSSYTARVHFRRCCIMRHNHSDFSRYIFLSRNKFSINSSFCSDVQESKIRFEKSLAGCTRLPALFSPVVGSMCTRLYVCISMHRVYCVILISKKFLARVLTCFPLRFSFFL